MRRRWRIWDLKSLWLLTLIGEKIQVNFCSMFYTVNVVLSDECNVYWLEMTIHSQGTRQHLKVSTISCRVLYWCVICSFTCCQYCKKHSLQLIKKKRKKWEVTFKNILLSICRFFYNNILHCKQVLIIDDTRFFELWKFICAATQLCNVSV